ncbi:MAG: Tox-REase-5 domain-containing protein, partial [Luteibacter sp.]
MAAVVIPAAEGLAALAAATVSALGIRELVETTQATPRTKERDCADTPLESECRQCKLGDGHLGQAFEPRFINKKNLINYRYQLYIANLYAAPERFAFTRYRDAANEEVNITWERIKDFFGKGERPLTATEWSYNGIWFDGFWRRYCTVVEAKGNYDWMFP